MSLDDIETSCVAAFPLSETRAKIMAGLRTIADRLVQLEIQGELWIDGSFLTEKINADDCDLVLRTRGEFYDAATEEQQAAIDWVLANLKEELDCHSFGFFEYDEADENYWIGHYDYCYWMRQWGFSRKNEYKGIAVFDLRQSASEQEVKENEPAA